MTEAIKPTTGKSRILSLDVLRGFALFGIALVNVLGFNASFFDFGGFYGSLPDPVQQNFYNIYIGLTADKFIFIYSFLFGYGFCLQYQKYGIQGSGFAKYYKRRLFYLALFGIVHIVFLWAGDILLLYALAGFLLFIVRKVPDRILFVLGFFFYFFIAFWLLLSTWFPLAELSSTCKECLNDAKQIYPSGNYYECFKLRLVEYNAFLTINLIYYFPKIMGVFIFGFLASKYKLHQQVSENRIKWTLIFLVVSSMAVLLYFYYEKWVIAALDKESVYLNAVFMGAYELMNLFMSSGYILLILLISSLKINILKPFAYAGRMSLTNYIMQSVFFSVIFYGWGFGQFGSTEPTSFFWYAIVIFSIQVIYSYFWLKNYKQGPLESLWRKLSYKDL